MCYKCLIVAVQIKYEGSFECEKWSLLMFRLSYCGKKKNSTKIQKRERKIDLVIILTLLTSEAMGLP